MYITPYYIYIYIYIYIVLTIILTIGTKYILVIIRLLGFDLNGK